MNSTGTVLEANQRARKVLDRGRDQIVGRSFADFVAEEQREAAARLPLSGQRNWSLRLERWDGSQIPGAVWVTRIEAGGRSLVVASLCEEPAENEEELQQAQKMEALGRLASGVAHDFNNLLTTVLCTSSFLVEELPEGQQRDQMVEIRQASERAAALTRQLLAFSRSEVIQRRVIDLNGIAERMDKMLRRVIGENIDLVTILPSNLGSVRADPNQMEQVILNLAINARDAMPEGGKLTIETANVTLEEDFCRTRLGAAPGKYVLLAISDTGIGMSTQVRSHLFEPFFTTKARGRGTGLGLATVRGIVESSGGVIDVYSEKGHGTSFKIYLPQSEDGGDETAAVEARSSLVGGSETILLVEDEESVRAAIRRALEAHGYTVRESHSGEQALNILDERGAPIHMLITDLLLKGVVDGFQLGDLARARRPEARVLFMSGYTEQAIFRHGILEEGVTFLQKPFSLETLLLKTRETLDR